MAFIFRPLSPLGEFLSLVAEKSDDVLLVVIPARCIHESVERMKN